MWHLLDVAAADTNLSVGFTSPGVSMLPKASGLPARRNHVGAGQRKTTHTNAAGTAA